MAKKKWIQGMNMKEGALTQMAKKAGMSIGSYCAQKNLSPTARRRCNLRKTLGKLGKRK